MNTSPELVKTHLLRFYATFTSTTQQPDADLFEIRIKVWSDAFTTIPADTFSQACHMCAMSLTRHPTPADAFEFVFTIRRQNEAQQRRTTTTA